MKTTNKTHVTHFVALLACLTFAVSSWAGDDTAKKDKKDDGAEKKVATNIVYKYREVEMHQVASVDVGSNFLQVMKSEVLKEANTNESPSFWQKTWDAIVPDEILRPKNQKAWDAFIRLTESSMETPPRLPKGPAAVTLMIIGDKGLENSTSFFVGDDSREVVTRIEGKKLDYRIYAVTVEKTETAVRNTKKYKKIMEGLGLMKADGSASELMSSVTAKMLGNPDATELVKSRGEEIESPPMSHDVDCAVVTKLGVRKLDVIDSSEYVDDFITLVFKNFALGKAVSLDKPKAGSQLITLDSFPKQSDLYDVTTKEEIKLNILAATNLLKLAKTDAAYIQSITVFADREAKTSFSNKVAAFTTALSNNTRIIAQKEYQLATNSPDDVASYKSILDELEIRKGVVEQLKTSSLALKAEKSKTVVSDPVYTRTQEHISFSLAYCIKDEHDVKYDTSQGLVVAKDEDKRPVFLAMNYHFIARDKRLTEPSDDEIVPTHGVIWPYVMVGLRAEVEQFEPMVGIGMGVQPRLWNRSFGLNAWVGAVWAEKESLKGYTIGERAAGEFKDKEREFDTVYGVSLSWP